MTLWRNFIFALVLLTPLLLTIRLSLGQWLADWWAKRWVRVGIGALMASYLFGMLTLGIGNAADIRILRVAGMLAHWVTLIFALPLTFALLIAAAIRGVLSRVLLPREAIERDDVDEPRAGPEQPAPPSTSEAPYVITRRKWIQGAAAAVPFTSIGASLTGLALANTPARLPLVPMRFPNLPDDLVGLRVLQLTDLHLGYYVNAKDVEACMQRASALKPDLIVFTGDVADDLTQLGRALASAAALRPRLGTFGVLGNHEYYRGVQHVRRIYDRSDVRLLVDQGLPLRVGRASLFLAGTADPAHALQPGDDFYERRIESALDGAPSDVFRLLLCHRPAGFDAARALGANLTLSGHTHGGQVGFGGRSAFEPVFPDFYIWGKYGSGDAQLYTSSGFGHWMPFRLNCPTEAPVIELQRA